MLVNRFEGENGRTNLLNEIKTNRLVQHDENLAIRLADAGVVTQFLPTQRLIEQGTTNQEVYLLLAGEVRIFVNGRNIGERKARDFVGEMAMIDATATRAATVTPVGEVVALKIEHDSMQAIAEEFPIIYKPVAEVIATRLRDRARFHKAPNATKKMFIGCSVESLELARHTAVAFTHEPDMDCEVWNCGVFTPTKNPLPVLLEKADAVDFAAFFFSPDDQVTSRQLAFDAPRDNTIFELGLFLGKLGTDRTYILQSVSEPVKYPSDLRGVTPITYKMSNPNQINQAADSICTQLKELMRSQGPR